MMWCTLGKVTVCTQMDREVYTILDVHGNGWLSLECSRKGNHTYYVCTHAKRVQ